MQKRAAIWILDVFQTLPSFCIKAIVGLVPIHLHLQKLSGRAQLRVYALPHNHILCLLLESRPNLYNNYHYFLLDLLTPCQWERIKGPIIDMDNKFNKVFPSFDLHNFKFSLGSRIIDIFSSYFSFHSFSKYSKDNLISSSQQLNNWAIVSSEDPSYALIVTDISIKNNVAISIAYIHICDKPIVKTIHYAVNITSTKAKLFSIRYGINQATNIQEILKIVIIIDLLYVAQNFFDSLSYLFQVHSTSILKELRKFFIQNHNNSIEFLECLSQCSWSLYKAVDKEIKLFNSLP